MSEEPDEILNVPVNETPAERMEKLSPRQILQLIGTVSSSTDLDLALRNLCDSLAIIYNDNQVSIYNVGLDQHIRFFFTSGKNFYRPSEQAIIPGEGILGNSIKYTRSTLIEDYGQNKDFLLPHPGVMSELVVPIIFQSKLIALIDILSQKVRGLTQSDQTTMEALAASLGGVFFTLQKTQQLRLRADRDGLLNNLITNLSHATSVEDLLTSAAQELAKIPEVSQVSIHLSPTETLESD